MSKMIVCSKCKKWEQLKIITPFDKEGYWLICENCGKEVKLPNTEKTKELFDLAEIYTKCLCFAFVRKRDIELDDIRELVWEKITEVNAN